MLGKVAPKPASSARITDSGRTPQKIVIVGGGAAGFAAAEMLRRQGYEGSIVMLSDDDAPPVDRPNLSKDYLAGNAPEEWMPLREAGFYAEQAIDLRLTTARHRHRCARARTRTGRRQQARLRCAAAGHRRRAGAAADPRRDLPHVHTLRTLADSRAIIAQAATARSAVVIGASFIGLEVAASLRARGIEVHVVAPEKRPMERVLGPQLGDFVRAAARGARRHLPPRRHGQRDRRAAGDARTAAAPSAADLVVVGVGVRPRLALAEKAGLAVDRGVMVDACLQTSAPGIFAAGDIARWPDPHSGEAIRVEHWVVAQRQGQTAALNMLGAQEKFDAVPFFWSQHYDVPINYVGHAESWDDIAIDGDIAGRDCTLRYMRQGRVLAVASIYRDAESLAAEARMERDAHLS